MPNTLCRRFEVAGFAVELWQLRNGLFRAVYGLQVKSDLSYADAALELGACLMHGLTCEGAIDP